MALIKPLGECPGYAPVLAYWSYNLWYRSRPIGYDLIIKAYRQRAAGAGVPAAFVAIEEDMPVGMVSLKNDDLWSRKDLNPWLASLYVVPEFRRRGIAEALVGAVIEKARGLGYPELYPLPGPRGRAGPRSLLRQPGLAVHGGRRGQRRQPDEDFLLSAVRRLLRSALHAVRDW